jgi:hypothetical protein
MITKNSLLSAGIIIVFIGSTLLMTGCATSGKSQPSPFMSPIQEIFYSKTLGLQGPASAKELEPLANTRWRITSIIPKLEKPYSATEFSFNNNGILLESAELPNGTFVTDTHIYRVIGSTLILSKDSRTAFARFTIEGNTMTINADTYNLTLERTTK